MQFIRFAAFAFVVALILGLVGFVSLHPSITTLAQGMFFVFVLVGLVALVTGRARLA